MKTTTAVLLVAGLVGLIYITRKKRSTTTPVSVPKKSGQSSIRINVMWNPVESQWQEPWNGPELSKVVYPPLVGI